MEEQKCKRVRNATIVGAIFLVAVLLFVLIYQIVAIAIEKREIKELKEKIAYYQTLTIDEKETLEAMDTLEWIKKRARELGFELKGEYALD